MGQLGGERFKLRQAAVAYQYLIPIRPGWLGLDRPAPAPTLPVTNFTLNNVWSTPSGAIGSTIPSAKLGETSATKEQAEAYVQDARFADRPVWQLNLVKYDGPEGEASYATYGQKMGQSGLLPRLG